MEEPLPVLDSPPEAPQPHALSLAARLLNVFAIPGEVFAGVRASRSSIGNWLVPALLLAIVGVVTAVVVVSQPAFQRQIRDLTEQEAKTLDQQVKAGKVKQPDADRALALTRAITTLAALKSLCSVGAAVVGIARVFWWGFVLWFLGRMFLKVRFGYPKALEAAGLGLMINVLGAVVMLLLVVNLPRLFSAPGLAYGVSDFDLSRQSPLLVGVANVFSLWLLGVLSVGLAKLAGVPFLRAAWLVFAAWAIEQSLFLLLGGVLMQIIR
jgi:Yip1 domain